MKHTTPAIFIVLIVAVLGFPQPAKAADNRTGAQPAEARHQQPENYCLGGIEDRKIIVDESQVSNPFRETTRLGCEVDGGDPHTMPDLPTPTAELRLLV